MVTGVLTVRALHETEVMLLKCAENLRDAARRAESWAEHFRGVTGLTEAIQAVLETELVSVDFRTRRVALEYSPRWIMSDEEVAAEVAANKAQEALLNLLLKAGCAYSEAKSTVSITRQTAWGV